MRVPFIYSILISIFILGCATPKTLTVYKPMYKTIPVLPKLIRPEYKELDDTKSLSDVDNIRKLLYNITDTMSYVKKLELNVNYYEIEVSKLKDLSRKKDNKSKRKK